jgi:hypothetical protein
MDDNTTWFKSSFSASGNCLEAAFKKSSFCLSDNCLEAAFKKSSFSAHNGGCVEAALSDGGTVLVRDTKDRSKPAHEYTAGEWDAFIKGVKAGEFDLP